MKKLLLFVICIELLTLGSCAKTEFNSVSLPTPSEEKYIPPRLEAFLLTQPDSLRDFYIEKHHAIVTLINYLRLDGTQYVLDISKPEALKQGVSNNMYDLLRKEVDDVNADVARNLSRSVNVHLSDPQRGLARYNDPSVHINYISPTLREKSRAIASVYSGMIGSSQGIPCYVNQKLDKSVSKVTLVCKVTFAFMATNTVLVTTDKGSVGDMRAWDYSCKSQTFNFDMPSYTLGSQATISYTCTAILGGDCSWDMK